MQSFGVLIDEGIIQSIFHTNTREIRDMISFGLIVYLLILWFIPSVVIYLVPLKISTIKQKCAIISILILSIGLSYTLCGRDVIFVFKSYKQMELMPNPIAPIRSLILYAQHSQERHFKPFIVAEDATFVQNEPQIILLVIGESARAENYTLNGYERITNPYTKDLPLLNFSDFYACGVITAISVPCMLTHYTREEYTHRNMSLYVNNILDIAQSVGYEVWYLGNNSGDCAGKCERNIANSIIYPSDSLDGVVLVDLERIVMNTNRTKHKAFIVMHLYGSHGASYFKRYPKEFTHFSPVCDKKELSKCSKQAIINAYDNSLIYTDYILAKSINTLSNAQNLRTMLWYVSDHGESLGEFGQYMHGGLGYALAPKVQKHIPSIMWFSRGWEKESANAKKRLDSKLSHDYVFHTLLTLLGIHANIYDSKLDILSADKP